MNEDMYVMSLDTVCMYDYEKNHDVGFIRPSEVG